MLNLQPPKTIQIPQNSSKLTPRATPNMVHDYHFLRLEWTEEEEKFEYVLRYNISRNGFWIASAPDRCK